MRPDLSLPPTITFGPTSVGVSVFTGEGVSVTVRLPRPRGLDALPEQELVERARDLASNALSAAARSLGRQPA